MSYKIIVRPVAEKFILRLNESDYGAIVERLRSLAEEPRPLAVRKLYFVVCDKEVVLPGVLSCRECQ